MRRKAGRAGAGRPRNGPAPAAGGGLRAAGRRRQEARSLISSMSSSLPYGYHCPYHDEDCASDSVLSSGGKATVARPSFLRRFHLPLRGHLILGCLDTESTKKP